MIGDTDFKFTLNFKEKLQTFVQIFIIYVLNIDVKKE